MDPPTNFGGSSGDSRPSHSSRRLRRRIASRLRSRAVAPNWLQSRITSLQPRAENLGGWRGRRVETGGAAGAPSLQSTTVLLSPQATCTAVQGRPRTRRGASTESPSLVGAGRSVSSPPNAGPTPRSPSRPSSEQPQAYTSPRASIAAECASAAAKDAQPPRPPSGLITGNGWRAHRIASSETCGHTRQRLPSAPSRMARSPSPG